MFKLWFERRRWRRSPLFEEAVLLALEEIIQTYAEKALQQARRKAKRRHQPVRRKWVWREVASRLDAAQSCTLHRKERLDDGPAARDNGS